MRFFKRVVEIIVGDDKGGTRIDGSLNVDFHVTKNIENETADEAVITFTNLSPETKKAITEEYKSVSLRAGYENAVSLMFTGDVKSVHQQKNGTDWLLTINCGDGYQALSNSTTNKTYSAGTQIKTIIEDVAKDMGLPSVIKESLSKVLPRGKVISGESKKSLSQLATAHQFDWSIQDGQLVVTQHSQVKDAVYSLDFDSGLLEAPQLIETGEDTRQSKGRTGVKYKFKSFLIPSLRPDDYIEVKGILYRITEIQGIGSSRSGDYSSVIEAIPV